MARKRKRPGKNLPVPGDKASKGLRYSSLRVCQKVEEKKVTTYNEVQSITLKCLIELVAVFFFFVQVSQLRR